MLNATPGLDDIPREFSLYLDNIYYTEYIGKELKHKRYNSIETAMTANEFMSQISFTRLLSDLLKR